jgi:hypothetical protein
LTGTANQDNLYHTLTRARRKIDSLNPSSPVKVVCIRVMVSQLNDDVENKMWTTFTGHNQFSESVVERPTSRCGNVIHLART